MALLKHHKGWSIGDHRVEVEVNASVLMARVDGASPPVLTLRSNLLGAWSFDAGSRVVELRRVRTLDVARSELWIDGIRVPPSRDPIALRKAANDARCKPHATSHERTAGAYREPGLAPVATIECGVCGAPVCTTHGAVDGVRCVDCFGRAGEQLRSDDRKMRALGLLLAAALLAAVAIFGLVARSPQALTCAVGMTFVVAFSVVRGLLKEKGLLRERQATRAELGRRPAASGAAATDVTSGCFRGRRHAER